MTRVDCISRADAIQAMQDKAKKLTNEDTINGLCGAVAILFDLPSVTPQLSSELEKNFGELDCISRADALRVAKNEYLRGWHDALCKALSEKYSIHCEEGNFSVIQEETITGLGLSMNCALGKDGESYVSTMPSVTPIRPKGHWIDGYCSECGCDVPAYIVDWKWQKDMDAKFCPNCGAKMFESQEREE